MRRQRVAANNNSGPQTKPLGASFVQGGTLNPGQTTITNSPAAAVKQVATAKPTQPATPKPTQPATPKTAQPATAKPTQPATPKSSQPAAKQVTVPMPKLEPPPIPKIENILPDELMQLDSQNQSGNESEGKKLFRWMSSTKKPSVRVKERRIRQNRRLRKILIPKNALMALHEVKGAKLSDFVINSRVEGGFSAKLSVNNMPYEGIGNSKMAAKNAACEKALRDLVIFKMIQSDRKGGSENGSSQPSQASQEEPNNQENDVEMKDEDLKALEENEVPILNLASFALFKLFSEWENEGFEIPEFRPPNQQTGAAGGGGGSGGGGSTPPPPNIRKELPPNWEMIHPTSLLSMMRPGIKYMSLGDEGQPPNTIQRVGVSVDGRNFIGESRSRKLARRNVAVDACNALFNTNFTKEN